ncbi:MAG: DUF4230 domain-containing protein, partial [Firmicutes bacterium]|nr:DUF4230 domain-containing protein [Bacillota bacterium]
MRNRKLPSVYVLLTGIIVFSIIGLIAFHEAAPAQASVPAAAPGTVSSKPSRASLSIIKVKEEISSQVIEDSLKDMGELATQEYYFKEVVSYSSVKSFLNIPLSFTESSYLVGYEGIIKAGIDLSKIGVSKNDETSVITISLPKAQILSTEIDTDSFELYSEKEGLGNHISVNEYNNSLSELKKTAQANAEKRGLL